jgi:hypothetical protein
MSFRGWHGCTDPKHVLMAASYAPENETEEEITGFLSVLFRGGQTVCHENVPLQKYEAIIKVPYALNYYHTQIKLQYPRVGDPPPPPPIPDGEAVQEKLDRQSQARIKAATEAKPIPLDLFGNVEMSGAPKRSRKSSMNR